MTSEPSVAPSRVNCTPTTPTLSVAVAETDVRPLTVVPVAGAVMTTEGGTVSDPVGGVNTTSTQ